MAQLVAALINVLIIIIIIIITVHGLLSLLSDVYCLFDLVM